MQATVAAIVDLHETQGAAWSDAAILVRGNDSADPFLEALASAGVPFRFMALSGLYTKPIILDALAYMRVVDLPFSSPSMYRVLSHPRLGINQADLAELIARKSREADRLADSGDLAGALRALETALRENPGDFKLSEKALSLHGRLAKKLTVAERTEVEQRYYRAVEQYLKGNYDTAAKLAEEVLQADPTSEAGKVLKEKIEAAAGLAR